MKDPIKVLTLRIPAAIHQKLKILAAVQDRTMTDILIECVEERYSKQKKSGLIP